MTSDRILGGIFTLIGVVILLQTPQIMQNFPGSGDPGPRLVPYILGALLTVLGAVLALRSAKPHELSADAKDYIIGTQSGLENPEVGILMPPSLPRRCGIALSFVGFIALLDTLGFSLAATLFLAISMSLMDELTLRRVLMRSAVSVMVVVILGLALSHLLKLSVPGVWFA